MPKSRIDSAEKVIQASPDTIYQAFIHPQSMIQWLPPTGMSGQIDLFEPHKNGRYQFTLTYENSDTNLGKTSKNTDVSKGIFLELVPDQKIIMAGIFDSDDPKFAGEMIQTWYFEAVDEGTKVIIICENVPEGIRKEDHMTGLNSTLNNLANFTERIGKNE